ncbi:MAG TPA: hypothetical protein VNF99_03615 [Stellaceae bacterium]|nr:hypothetical protein [Stellaceae bacterium]
MKPIPDKAEIAVDFPDKTYVGVFSQQSGFALATDTDGVSLKLLHSGPDRRSVDVHLHWHLFADILGDLATAITATPLTLDETQAARLLEAVGLLDAALHPHHAKARRK